MTVTLTITDPADPEYPQTVTVCLPGAAQLVEQLLPLYRANGQLASTPDTTGQVREILRQVFTEGGRELEESLRDLLRDAQAWETRGSRA